MLLLWAISETTSYVTNGDLYFVAMWPASSTPNRQNTHSNIQNTKYICSRRSYTVWSTSKCVLLAWTNKHYVHRWDWQRHMSYIHSERIKIIRKNKTADFNSYIISLAKADRNLCIIKNCYIFSTIFVWCGSMTLHHIQKHIERNTHISPSNIATRMFPGGR